MDKQYSSTTKEKQKLQLLLSVIRYLEDIIDISNDIGNIPILSLLIDNNIDRLISQRNMQKPGHTHCLLKPNSHHLYILCLKGFSLFLLWSFLYLRSFLYILFCLSFSPGSHGCLTVFSRWLTIISQALWDKIGAKVSFFFFPEKELRKMSYVGCEALREREEVDVHLGSQGCSHKEKMVF